MSLLACFLCFCSFFLLADANETVQGTVHINGTNPIAETDENFVCATLDWWPPEYCNDGLCVWGNASILNLDINNNILFNAVKGNELGGRPIHLGVSAGQYVSDTNTLRSLIKEIYQQNCAEPLILAPGGTVEELIPRILNPSYLDNITSVFNDLQTIIKNSSTSVSAWVSEAGGIYNSGRDGVSNAFVNSFWYVDQLGMSASYDTKVYCRQSLIGGNYGLLNVTTFIPNPDYYSALLWKRLMGRKVLSTKFTGPRTIRAYAHCAEKSEGLTVLLINLDGNTTVEADMKFIKPGTAREEYRLTPMGGNIQSNTVLLNGKTLTVDSSGAIPALEPVTVNPAGPVTIHPFSIVFVHLPDVVIQACK